jgi:hypothetical protein
MHGKVAAHLELGISLYFGFEDVPDIFHISRASLMLSRGETTTANHMKACVLELVKHEYSLLRSRIFRLVSDEFVFHSEESRNTAMVTM